MKTVQYFAFYPHNLPKITFFCHVKFYEPQNTKSLHLNRGGWKSSAPLPVFTYLISPLQISTNTSLNFSSYIYNEVIQYRLNPHGYCLDFVSDVDCNAFLPRIQNFQARKIIVSGRENFILNTRIHFILYENEVYSGKE